MAAAVLLPLGPLSLLTLGFLRGQFQPTAAEDRPWLVGVALLALAGPVFYAVRRGVKPHGTQTDAPGR